MTINGELLIAIMIFVIVLDEVRYRIRR